ncbi:MAG: pyridoxamine 5'-phosphate oxidase family protein [Burkholderiaceae bacterium]|nr:pyridoxamine 5'-phosphate oxidase family protein [Burkholderiaceae bacterium]
MSKPTAASDAATRVRALLSSHSTMTLASAGAGGPWAAPVFYAERFGDDGSLRLVFVSSPASRHALELDADVRVAAAVHDDARDWQSIRGVQLAGRARALGADESGEARRLYAAKFPVIGDPACAPEPIARAFEHARWFVLVVERAFLTDNTVAFGKREEVVYTAP